MTKIYLQRLKAWQLLTIITQHCNGAKLLRLHEYNTFSIRKGGGGVALYSWTEKIWCLTTRFQDWICENQDTTNKDVR